MSVIVFAELSEGKYKKTSQEAIYYGAQLASQMAVNAIVLAIGAAEESELALAGNYGASKVLHSKFSFIEIVSRFINTTKSTKMAQSLPVYHLISNA